MENTSDTCVENSQEFVSPPCKTPRSNPSAMSDSLRARLKRSSRYFVSPETPKRPCHPQNSPVTPVKISPVACLDKPVSCIVENHYGLAVGSCSTPTQQRCRPAKAANRSTMHAIRSVSADESLSIIHETGSSTQLSSFHGDVNETGSSTQLSSFHSDVNDTGSSAQLSSFDSGVQTLSIENLRMAKSRLQQVIGEREELLRKLNLVKSQREKNDMEALILLTSKWRTVIQQVIVDLWTSMPEPKPSLADLIDSYQLDYKMIGYQADDETFIEGGL